MSKNEIIVVAGFRGSGKTTFACELLKKKERVIIFDPNEDTAYDWCPNTVYSLHEGERSLEQFLRWVFRTNARTYAVRYIPDNEADLFEEAQEFSRMVWLMEASTVCYEEIHQVCATPAPASMPSRFRKLVNRGRHQRISIVVTGLRYQEIPRPVTAGADFHVVFHTSEPGDLDALRSRVGPQATQKIMELGEHEAVLFATRGRKWEVVDSYGQSGSGERDKETDEEFVEVENENAA